MNKQWNTAAAKSGLRWRWPGWAAVTPALLTVAITAILLSLGLANIVIRATWHEADDGVLWVSRVEGVTAFDVAPGTPADRVGIRPVSYTHLRAHETDSSLFVGSVRCV